MVSSDSSDRRLGCNRDAGCTTKRGTIMAESIEADLGQASSNGLRAGMFRVPLVCVCWKAIEFHFELLRALSVVGI